MSVRIEPDAATPAPARAPAPAHGRPARTRMAKPASAVAQARRALAGAGAHALVRELESELVSGKGSRLRRALKKLPAVLVERERRAGEREDEPEEARRVGGEAHGRPQAQGPVRLHLPLPDEGEADARVAEEAEGDRALVRVDLDLRLAQLGELGVTLLADRGSLRCTIESDDAEARVFLSDAVAQLGGDLAAAYGKPTLVALDRRGSGVDAYV